jgi:hypothetical protein
MKLSVGVVADRTELEQWAAYMGVDIEISDSGIPYVDTQRNGLMVAAQSPQEPHQSEVARLRAELAATKARLDAQLASANAGTVEDGHQYECCGKVGRISPHKSWCPGVTR